MKSPSDILTPLLLTIFGRYLCGAGSSGGSLKICTLLQIELKMGRAKTLNEWSRRLDNETKNAKGNYLCVLVYRFLS